LIGIGHDGWMRVVITMPVLDDWQAARMVCNEIDRVLISRPDVLCTVLLIDDGSMTAPGPAFATLVPQALHGLQVLVLRRNLGHQRAIAIALAYIQEHIACDAVVVMDADGEDRPEDIPRLLATFEQSPAPVAVFARRGRRVEGWVFKSFYALYRGLHVLLTGRGISFGNFSVLPRQHLTSLVCYPELWNHYAAAVINSRLPWTTIVADRAARAAGESKMKFTALVMHGLSALFAYQETVSTRILIGSAGLCAVLFLTSCLLIFTHLFGQDDSLTPLLLGAVVFPLAILQILAMALGFVFAGMVNRSNLGFLPLRDFRYFVSECKTLASK
jgi:polyisoprenyl-phosphate glycosyltransferase